MKHENLDKLFRSTIENDASELSEQEQLSKANVWAALEEERPARKVFPIWKLAAAVFFLLWLGTGYFFMNSTQKAQQAYRQLEKSNSVNQVSIQNLEAALIEMREQDIPSKVAEEMPAESKQIEYRYVEKRVELRDTVLVEKMIAVAPEIRLVRDTVFIEIPVEKETAKFVQLDTLPTEQPKARPSKMEFVFSKERMETPTERRLPILINEQEIAKKKAPHNNGLIIVKIN